MLFRKEEFTAYAREGVVDQAIFDLDAQLKVTTERYVPVCCVIVHIVCL